MISKLRDFSKTKLATVIVAIIIVPFVFWGMGSVFSGGNTNSVAKINSYNVSTDDFINHINKSRIATDYIRENLDNNILDDLLNDLVASSIIDLEIKDLKLFLTDKNLAKLIRSNNMFLDSKNKFSRTKYEKFLLENNLSPTQFEYTFKNNHLKKNLFQYISGGIKSPYFLTNQIYKDENRKIEISYINLNNVYKKKNSFSNDEIQKFISENKDKLKIDFIDFSYAKLTPKNLSQSDEFTDDFFTKIDLIENEIINGKKIDQIIKNYNLEILRQSNYSSIENENKLFNEIYNKRNEDNIQLLDKNDYFLIYEITNIENKLPNLDNKFLTSVRESVYENHKYEINKKFFEEIQNKKITLKKFKAIVNNNDKLINNISLKSIADNEFFSNDSIKLIYSMPNKSFLLTADKKNNIYLVYINNIISKNITNNDGKMKLYSNQSVKNIKNNLYKSYDLLMNDKYKVKLNQKTLDRIKNHFK
tara:strand:- start:5172 stop:6599 length:1428 start_codon:yes stop_codon:yes gene_type:complete